jgi:putative Ca2+/H+ antiporter (TMEM165/GDT1 family)
MNRKLFLSTFWLIFVAELPDKTAFATLLLATRGKPLPVFVGAALAFTVQSLIAVAFGSVFASLPERWVHLATGVLFLVFALLALLRKDDSREESEIQHKLSARQEAWKIAWRSFLVIFIAEWGDLTQLASASLVARFHEPLTIFVAATAALWCVTAIAIGVGHHMRRAIHPRVLRIIAAAAFAMAGCYLIFTSSV